MLWYYEREREQKGPVEESELKQLFDSGYIDSSNLVWSAEMRDWETYGSVFGTAAPAPTAASLEAVAEVSGTGGQTPNAELRAQARNALNGSWGMAALAVFLWQVVVGAVGVVPLLGPLVQLAIGGAMMVGLYGFFTTLHRSGVADVGVLFQGFSQFWSALGIYFITGLIIFISAFIAAVPGIAIIIYADQTSALPPEQNPLFFAGIALVMVSFFIVWAVMMLRYSMVYFIARDEPDLGVNATIQASVEMMKGRKMKLFFLGLSFIGWHFLGMLALFIGMFWSSAYMFAAFAAFYDDLQEA